MTLNYLYQLQSIKLKTNHEYPHSCCLTQYYQKHLNLHEARLIEFFQNLDPILKTISKLIFMLPQRTHTHMDI